MRLDRIGGREALLLTVIALAAGDGAVQGQARCSQPWDVAEVARHGSIDGDVTFSDVRDITVGPDGRIYVAQSLGYAVLVLDRAGSQVERIGRSGRGPGEFRATPNRLAWRSDTLVVVERFATHFLSLHGDGLRRVQFRVRVPEESSVFHAGKPLADGSFVGYRFLTQPTRVFFESPRLPLLRFSPTGEILDTIATIPRPPPVGDSRFRNENENAMLSDPVAAWQGESRLPVVLTADGSSVIFVGEVLNEGSPSSFDLVKLSITGDTIFRRTIGFQPREITDRERSEIREGVGAFFAGEFISGGPATRGDPSRRERARAEASAAWNGISTYPPVRRIVAGADGTIWLLRESAPAPADLWEIYDGEGVRIGSIRITEGRTGPAPWAPRLVLFHASLEEFIGVSTDDLDVPYISRFEIRSECAGAR